MLEDLCQELFTDIIYFSINQSIHIHPIELQNTQSFLTGSAVGSQSVSPGAGAGVSPWLVVTLPLALVADLTLGSYFLSFDLRNIV